MKKICIGAFLLVFLAGFASAQISRGGTVWISSKTVTLKSSTWFFASNKGSLSYGDQAVVLQVSGNWAEVRSSKNSALTGWVSSANLSARRIVVTASSGGASASEIALAGKGFNQEVENAYKAEGNLNYADVDRTEAIRVPQEDLYTFVINGHLAGGEER